MERPSSSSAIVYVYRRGHLERLLADPAYREFLGDIGYTETGLDGMLSQLSCHLETQPEFPQSPGC